MADREEDDIRVIEDGDEVIVSLDSDEPPKKIEAEKAAPAADDHEDDEDDEAGGDSNLKTESLEASDEDREAKRQARQRAKERQRAAKVASKRTIEELQGTVAEMAKRLALYEKRNVAADMERTDQTIAQTRDYLARCNEAKAAAIKAQDGDAVAKIDEAIFQARLNLNGYETLKRKFAEEVARAPTTIPNEGDRQPRVSPVTKSYAEEWAAKNKWYDPQGRDRDSRLMFQLSNDLANEGHDPETQEYWDELNKLAAQYLPHKAAPNGARNGQNNGARTMPTGGGGGTGRREGTTAANEVRVPKQLIQEWTEAGIWEDPKRRAVALKDYKRIQADIKGRAA